MKKNFFLTIIFLVFISTSCIKENNFGYEYFMKYAEMGFALDKNAFVNDDLSKNGELAYLFVTSEDKLSDINNIYITDDNYNVIYELKFRDGEAKLIGSTAYFINIDNPTSSLGMSVDKEGIYFEYLEKSSNGTIQKSFVLKVDSKASNDLLKKLSESGENIHFNESK